MYQLYVGQRLTIEEVADEVDCTYKTAQRWLHKHDSIEVRTSNSGTEKQKDRVTVSCANCGGDVEVTSGYAEKYDKKFCDEECMSEGYEGMNRQESTKVDVDCSFCGESMKVYPSRQDRDRHFCNQSCYSSWQSENRRGDNHPTWKGGHLGSYGPDWNKARRQVRERDKICQRCGTNPNRKLDVHHIQPVRTFENRSEAHTLDNLVGLCRSCHHTLEHLPESKQREIIS